MVVDKSFIYPCPDDITTRPKPCYNADNSSPTRTKSYEMKQAKPKTTSKPVNSPKDIDIENLAPLEKADRKARRERRKERLSRCCTCMSIFLWIGMIAMGITLLVWRCPVYRWKMGTPHPVRVWAVVLGALSLGGAILGPIALCLFGWIWDGCTVVKEVDG